MKKLERKIKRFIEDISKFINKEKIEKSFNNKSNNKLRIEIKEKFDNKIYIMKFSVEEVYE